MVVVRSPVRSCVRSVVRDVFGVVDGQTDLQRILALSPSLLVWPAQGAGWQGTSGGTLAASGQPLGLGVDLSQLQGKTLAEWLATAPELVSNPGPFTDTTGWTAPLGTIEVSASKFVLTCTTNGRAVAPALTGLTVGRVYQIILTGVDGTASKSLRVTTNSDGSTGAVFTQAISGSSITHLFTATATTHYLTLVAIGTAGQTFEISTASFKELPGNHLRAGTWASPSDAARGTFQNNAINLDGVNDYYSLLNAISITTDMTVVRAFKRASAGIRSIGLGTASINLYDAYWLTDNTTATALGNAGAIVGTANTSTGSFVFSSVRNAATTLVRRNGAQIGSTTAPGVANSFGAVGLMNTVYNSGEISFLAVFPTELTGANLALVEQIAASTNGSVLA